MNKGLFRELKASSRIHLGFVIGIALSLTVVLVQKYEFFEIHETPEAAYWHQYKVEPEIMIMGEHSALLLHAGKEETKQHYTIIKKGTRGWEDTEAFETEITTGVISSDSGFYVSVYRVKETQENYIHVFARPDKTLQVIDNRESEFIFYEIVETESGFRARETEKGTQCYAYVPALDDEYELQINGEVVEFL